MTSLISGVRIHGAKEVLTKTGKIRPAALKRMREVTQARADDTVARYRQAMGKEYTSQWATGALARSVKADVKNEEDGVSVSIKIANLRELQYVTGILPDSYFKSFPIGEFWIAPKNVKLLSIRLPGHVRKFIQNPVTGRMEGSKAGRFLSKGVMWGTKGGASNEDVIAQVTAAEAQSFAEDLQAAVASGISEATK